MNLRPGPHGQKAKNEGMCLLEGDFPGGSDGKASAYNAGPRFDPWVGKIPWRREWQPAPVLLPGKSHGWRSLVHSMGSWTFFESLCGQEADNDGRCSVWMGEMDMGKKVPQLLWSRADA